MLHTSPVLYVDPGMSAANMRWVICQGRIKVLDNNAPRSYVTVLIDLDLPVNKKPVTAHEDSEVIEVLRVPCHQLQQALDAKAADKWTIDARLYT